MLPIAGRYRRSHEFVWDADERADWSSGGRSSTPASPFSRCVTHLVLPCFYAVQWALFFPADDQQHHSSIRVSRYVFKWKSYKRLYKSISLKCCWNIFFLIYLLQHIPKVLESGAAEHRSVLIGTRTHVQDLHIPTQQNEERWDTGRLEQSRLIRPDQILLNVTTPHVKQQEPSSH